jgi:hypothetical protein
MGKLGSKGLTPERREKFKTATHHLENR